MAKLSELYKRRDTTHLPVTAVTSCLVSVEADAQFILEKNLLRSWIVQSNLRVAFDSCGVYKPSCKIIAIEIRM